MSPDEIDCVSHELRTPLHTILGLSELIRDQAPDASRRLHADLILRSGQHLQALTLALLDMVHLSDGNAPVHGEALPLQQLVSTMVEVHRVAAERKGLGIALAMDPALLKATVAPATRPLLTRVLHLLVQEAVRCTTDGGIWVTVAAEGSHVRVRVLDTGPGPGLHGSPLPSDNFERAAVLASLLEGSLTVEPEPHTGTLADLRMPVHRLAGARAH